MIRLKPALALMACLFATTTFPAAPSQAQDYPSRPVKVIVPFGAGGPADVTARQIGSILQESFGQPFVVENRTGAGGVIGTVEAAKSPPDGYTLLMMSNTQTANESLVPQRKYELMRDLAPIAPVNYSDLVIVVHPGVPATTLQEFIALAKAAPDTIHYASSGNGSSQHLMGGLFVAMTGAPLAHVPYKGSSGAASDLVAGVVESSFAGVPNALAQLPAGRLRALAVTTVKRAPQLPAVPTMQEAGVAGYEASVWLALLAPAGTPRGIVGKLNTEVAKVLNAPDTRKALHDAGVESTPSTPEAMSAYMAQEMARWGKVVKDAGIKLE